MKLSLRLASISGYCFVATALTPFKAFATTAGGGLPFDSWMTKIGNSVTGPLAFTLSVCGLVLGGGALLLSNAQMNDGVKFLISVSIFLCFTVFAKNMLTTFFGVGAAFPV